MNIPDDPFKDLALDEEELAIEEAIEKGEYRSVSNIEESKKMLQDAAKRYTELNQTKPVTLRIKQIDLIRIKAKASRNGLPYQTMLSALLHDFAEGNKELVIK